MDAFPRGGVHAKNTRARERREVVSKGQRLSSSSGSSDGGSRGRLGLYPMVVDHVARPEEHVIAFFRRRWRLVGDGRSLGGGH